MDAPSFAPDACDWPGAQEGRIVEVKQAHTPREDDEMRGGTAMGTDPSPEAYAALLQENAQLRQACAQAQQASVVYNHLAHALARGYTDLFYVNLETDECIEYHTDDESGVLSESRRVPDFFESCTREVKLFVHQDDQELFINAMNREFLTQTLSRTKVFEMTYRRIKDGRQFYVQMKATRMEDDNRIVVIAVSDIDELVRQRRAEERIREERVIYARLHAITGNFIAIYVVDPQTGKYREFSTSDDYAESYGLEKEGDDFFATSREATRRYAHPADLSRFLAVFTKENVMAAVDQGGIFTLGYRLIFNGAPLHVQIKAAMVEEDEGSRLIVGLNDIDAQVRQEMTMERRLEQAKSQANFDALTGVRNRHAYLETERRIDHQIAAGVAAPFAIVMLDVNDLKIINDTKGHQAGDQCLREACRVICDIFKHSPVYRVGGDEFVVIAQGVDYECLNERIEEMGAHNERALRSGNTVIACGAAKHEQESHVATVFERADHSMYEDKNHLKAKPV